LLERNDEEEVHGRGLDDEADDRVDGLPILIDLIFRFEVRLAADHPDEGVMMSLTSESTIAPNATPMMTAVARSTMFPGR
jgi:hypothetical protein